MSNAGGVALDGVRGLVTGANRGLGRAFVDELLERGACIVYAAARNADSVAVDDDRIVPVTLDVTNRIERTSRRPPRRAETAPWSSTMQG